MNDLISRQDVLKTVCAWMVRELGYLDLNRVERLIDALEALPSTERTGKWMEDKRAEAEHQLMYFKVWTCEDCGAQECRQEPTNYCPDCGRIMKVGE